MKNEVPSMSDDRARSIAEEYLAAEEAAYLASSPRPPSTVKWTRKFLGVTRQDDFPGEVSVIFGFLNENGQLMDANSIVVIDERTGEARVL
jgi:hypothetical protein